MDKTPLDITLDVVCGKWKSRILWTLLQVENIRFNELQRLLGGTISARILSRELKMLLEDGLIERIDHEKVPPKVEYLITEYGRSTYPFLHAMNEWGKKHTNTASVEIEMMDLANE